MPLHMVIQVSFYFEFLPALVTFMLIIRLLHFHVNRIVVASQIMRVSELLVAFLASYLRFVRMHYFLMLLQTNSGMEEFIA